MRDSLSGVQGHLAFCQERTVSDDCGVDSESKLLLSQAGKVSNDYNFTVHIVTVFSAQISGAARVARCVLGGCRGWAIELESGKKKSQEIFQQGCC